MLSEQVGNVIEEPLFPFPDIPLSQVDLRVRQRGGNVSYIPDIVTVQYSDEKLKKYVQLFFLKFIEEYNIIVKTCFPTRKQQLAFYRSQPILVVVECDTNNLNRFNLKYGYVSNSVSKNTVQVRINPESSVLDTSTFEVIHSLCISHILRADLHALPIDPDLNTTNANEACILRNWVYERLKEDLNYMGR